MAEDEKAKAEKLAAAKKRVEQMKKAKAKKGPSAKKDESSEKTADVAHEEPAEATPEAKEETEEADLPTPLESSAPSLAQQSRARSTSFRKGSTSVGPASPSGPSGTFSPEGETAPDIYRKQVARIEELEKENRRVAKEAVDAEKRWQKAEEELADLREAEGDAAKAGGSGSEVEKLKGEVAALLRQNAQLQAQVARGAGSGSSGGGSPGATAELETQLRAKTATIETMELEMSRLRAQVERLSVSASEPPAQIAALEDKLARAERAAGQAQRALADLQRNLDRTAGDAVKAGSERASAETKMRTLEREAADAAAAGEEATRRADALDKKVATLTTLHREQDARMQALKRDKEAAEAEAARLRTGRDGGPDDEAVDELEDEGRRRLEARVRTLEAENTDLRRGIWHDRRRDMQVGPDGESPRAGLFSDVDLGATTASGRRGTGGFGGILATGLSALTGGAAHVGDDDLLDDGDDDFDEDAFRRAREEEEMKRIERIKEVKRGLKAYEGWRLDLVESRMGGGEGIGDIFDI